MRTLIFPIHIIATVMDRHRGNPPVSTFRSGAVRHWWIRREHARHRARDTPHFPFDEPHQDPAEPETSAPARDAWYRLCRFRPRTLGRRLDRFMPETPDFIRTHVTADHPVRQTRPERLADDAPFGTEIDFAAFHELRERQGFRHASPASLQHTDQRSDIPGL